MQSRTVSPTTQQRIVRILAVCDSFWPAVTKLSFGREELILDRGRASADLIGSAFWPSLATAPRNIISKLDIDSDLQGLLVVAAILRRASLLLRAKCLNLDVFTGAVCAAAAQSLAIVLRTPGFLKAEAPVNQQFQYRRGAASTRIPVREQAKQVGEDRVCGSTVFDAQARRRTGAGV